MRKEFTFEWIFTQTSPYYSKQTKIETLDEASTSEFLPGNKETLCWTFFQVWYSVEMSGLGQKINDAYLDISSLRWIICWITEEDWRVSWSFQINLPVYGTISSQSLECCAVLSRVRLFATPWTVAHQAPLSMELSRQAYCNGLPC